MAHRRLFRRPLRAVALFVAMVLLVAALFVAYTNVWLAATVNGQPISRYRIIDELERSSGREVLSRIIMDDLMEAALKNEGIVIGKDEVDATIAILEARLRSQGATLQEVLVQMGPQGLSEAAYRERVAKRLQFSKLLKKLDAGALLVTEAEVDEFIRDSEGPLFEGMSPEGVRVQVRALLEGRKLSDAEEKWRAEALDKAKLTLHGRYVVAGPVGD